MQSTEITNEIGNGPSLQIEEPTPVDSLGCVPRFFFFLSRTPYCGGCMVWHRMLFYELFYSLLLVGRAVANSLSAGEKK